MSRLPVGSQSMAGTDTFTRRTTAVGRARGLQPTPGRGQSARAGFWSTAIGRLTGCCLPLSPTGDQASESTTSQLQGSASAGRRRPLPPSQLAVPPPVTDHSSSSQAIIGLPFGGQGNQFLAMMNLLYLAKHTHRVAILSVRPPCSRACHTPRLRRTLASAFSH